MGALAAGNGCRARLGEGRGSRDRARLGVGDLPTGACTTREGQGGQGTLGRAEHTSGRQRAEPAAAWRSIVHRRGRRGHRASRKPAVLGRSSSNAVRSRMGDDTAEAAEGSICNAYISLEHVEAGLCRDHTPVRSNWRDY
jgi:hypothetical protein